MSTLAQDYQAAMQQLTGPGAPFEVGTATYDGIEYKVFKNGPKTLLEIFDESKNFGDKEFLVYEGERWTYNDLFQQAASLGYQLVNRYQLKKGERVAIAMRNYPEWLTAYIAITSVGGVAVLINSWGMAPELEFALENSGSRVVFCDQQRYDLVEPCLPKHGIEAIVARPERDSFPDNAVALPELIAGLDDVAMPEVDITEDDYVMMMYTSGTTGKPKGAPSTHRALCQALLNMECAAMASAMINPEAIGAMMEKGFDPTQMLAVPLFHVSGLHAVFLGALKGGRKVVMLYKWDVARAVEYVEQEKVTMVSAAPAMIMQMLESEDFEKADTSSVSGIGGGGSATTPHTAKLMCDKIPNSYPGTGWGLTETNSVGTALSGAPFHYKPGSAGFIHPTVDIQVRDEEGNELPQGIPGELWVKSPTLIKEYWNRPDANAKDFKDGWFNSGDVGCFDEEGYLFLSDRAKDMVIRGGENIYPAEIEGVIADHAAVQEVAAFGIPDESLGEQLAVAVVPRPGEAVSEDDVKQFASERLAKFKVPYYVFIRDQKLPRNPTGKILKKDLRTQYEEELGISA